MNASKAVGNSASNSIADLVLPAIAALWLAVSFQSLNALVADSIAAEPSTIANLIMSLSGTITGAVFGGAAAGHLFRSLNFPPFAGLPRLLSAASGGVVVGLIAAGLAYWIFSGNLAVASIIGGVAGIFSIIGGCLAAAKNRDVVFAGLVGMVVVLVLMFARGWFSNSISNVLRSDPNSYRWIGILAGVAIGMAVGVTAYLILRRRSGGTAMYGYLAAGAAPGALWLLSEVATRIAAALLVANTTDPDGLSGLMMDQSLDAQLNGSMATLFAGATTAVLAFGILLPRHNGPGKNNGKRPKITRMASEKVADTGTLKSGSAPRVDKSADDEYSPDVAVPKQNNGSGTSDTSTS